MHSSKIVRQNDRQPLWSSTLWLNISDRGLVYKNIRQFYQKHQSANKPEENGGAFKVYTKDKIKSTLFEWAEKLVTNNCTKASFEECQHNAEQDRLHKFMLSCSIVIYFSIGFYESIKERHATSLWRVYGKGKDTICPMCEILNVDY